MFYIVANHSNDPRYPRWVRVPGSEVLKTEEDARREIARREKRGENCGRRELPNDLVVVVRPTPLRCFEVELRHAADFAPVMSAHCTAVSLVETVERYTDAANVPCLPAATSGDVFP